MTSARTALLVVALAILASGCISFRSARGPMETSTFMSVDARETPSRAVILLPGFGDGPEAFVRNGFVDTLREADPATVVITPDAHFAYYRNRTVVERLYEDALRPAIETGAEEIWVVGISMGGAGALGLAQAHGDVIDRVLLLGPYMGGKIAREISDAGGLGAWEEHAVEGEGDRAAFFRRIWAWLDGYTVPGTERPDLHVGVGRDDRGFAASELLGVELPAGNFVAAEGGHDWSVWTPLFERFVDENTTGGNGASKAAPGGMSP